MLVVNYKGESTKQTFSNSLIESKVLLELVKSGSLLFKMVESHLKHDLNGIVPDPIMLTLGIGLPFELKE